MRHITFQGEKIMLLFVLSIAICAVIAVVTYAIKKRPTKLMLTSLVGLLVMIPAFVTSVPTGHTGIITTFGRVEDYTYEAGVHFKAPWNTVIKLDNRNQKASLDLECFSSDIQEVQVTYTVNYQIEKANAQTIYKNIGSDYYHIVMVPRIQEAVKSVIAQYNAEALIANREVLSTQIRTLLKDKVSAYNIEILDASIENLDFSDAFTDAVEAKQVAEQAKLKAAIEQEQMVLEATALAEREVIAAQAAADIAKIQAEADLEVIKIQADAAEYAGQKDAAINTAISNSLTPELLQYYYIKGWNGVLPSTYISQDSLNTILDITPASDEQPDN